jgi:type IV pilus assembly protein PilE
MTLLELMVVAAVVAILASIAYPSYQDQIRRSRRSKAESFMMEVSARQQQRFVDVRSYATTLAALNLTLPAELNGYYAVSTATVAGPPPTFTVTATPGGTQANDSCGELTLNQAGEKDAAKSNCW